MLSEMEIHINHTISIQSENDLHYKVVDFLKKHYPDVMFLVGLGELQDSPNKRCMAWKKGYRSGTCDIIILRNNEEFNGLAFEFKNPKGTGRVSSKQMDYCLDLSHNDFKVVISNNYDEIVKEIVMYMFSG
jgi:hypothetical protein